MMEMKGKIGIFADAMFKQYENWSEEEVRRLLFVYVSESVVIPYFPYEYYSLLKGDYLEEDGLKFKVTEAGKRYIEELPLQYLVGKIMSSPHSLNRVIVERLVAKVGMEDLPTLLSHNSPIVRALAKQRFEELKC